MKSIELFLFYTTIHCNKSLASFFSLINGDDCFFKNSYFPSYSWSKCLELPFSFDIRANVLVFGVGFVPHVHSILASPVQAEFYPLFHSEMPSLLPYW